MKNIKAWLVDDEADAYVLINGIIKEFCPEIELAGVSVNIEDAWENIRKEKPQLVFLDVNMPRGTGIDLLERFPVRKFEVILISGFPDNEKKIAKFRDVPFLHKPFSIDNFVDLVEKAVHNIRENPNQVHRFDNYNN